MNVYSLLQKNGFNKEHFLNKMFPDTQSKDGDGLFVVRKKEKKPNVYFNFEQYGKQRRAILNPLKELPEKFIYHLEKPANKYPQIRKEEETEHRSTLESTKEVGYGKYKGKVRYAKFDTKKHEKNMHSVL